MSDLLFTINVVLPITLIIVLGYVIKRLKLISGEVFNGLNKLCFKVLLPISLFVSIYNSSSIKDFNYQLILFIVIGILLLFFIGLIIVKLTVKDDSQKGVILQAIFRSNYAIVGLPLASSIGGEEALKIASLVALITIPIFNILATIALSIFVKENNEKIKVKDTIIKIIKNPLIIGVLLGLVCLIVRMIFENYSINFRIKDITFLYKTLETIGDMASPLALLTLGGLFSFESIKEMKKKVSIICIIRLVLIPLIVFSIALIFFNFNKYEYATLIPVFATPIAVSSAIMAKEMKNDGVLANQLVVWTTIFSTFSIFIIIYIFRLMEIF